MRTLNRPILVVEDDEEPITVTDDSSTSKSAAAAPAQDGENDGDEITIENPTPGGNDAQSAADFDKPQTQESAKHALATRLYKAVETAYGSVYELTDVLNEIGRRYKAPALKALGNQSVNLQASIEGMPGLLDGKHEKEDVIRFMGLMDEITND